jgi:hypothetical protein
MVAIAAVAVAFGPTGFPMPPGVGVVGAENWPVGVISHTDSLPPGVAVEKARLVGVGTSRFPITSDTGPQPAITALAISKIPIPMRNGRVVRIRGSIAHGAEHARIAGP